ncbi:MAG TPA: NRDE family protein [Myxococcales bacterium]|nr:NRDE family protein [Myxococcales bacterium]
MCTLIAAVRQYEDAPLVVAANRDERLDRPARAPLLWAGGPIPVIAGRDEQGGGTWLGLNREGLFVGVTNRYGVDRDPARQSRGALVVEALGAASAGALHARLAALDPARFNAFHLLYADRGEAFVTWSDGAALRQEVLAPGVHVVTERSLGGDDRARTETVRELWRGLPAGLTPSAEELFAILRHHQPDDPLGSVCVHLPELGYGTRSSCTLRLGRGTADVELWWAEGAPCTAAPQRLDGLAQALRAA